MNARKFAFGTPVALYQYKAKEVGMRSRNNHKLAIAAVGAHCLASVAIFGKALHYACAARREERAGFSYAAAFEWRKTAELLSGTPAADYAWRQWERIMQLPRRLAAPIGDSRTVAARNEASPSARSLNVPKEDQFLFAKAA